MKIKNYKYKQGYTLLELLFYISFFAILSLVVINAMIIMTKSFRETSIQIELAQSGSIMERISREIRQASSITSNTGTDIVLTNSSGAMEFNISGTNLQLVGTGNLNSPTIAVSAIPSTSVFTSIATATGSAVKVAFRVKSTNDALARTQDFYDTVVLRGDY